MGCMVSTPTRAGGTHCPAESHASHKPLPEDLPGSPAVTESGPTIPVGPVLRCGRCYDVIRTAGHERSARCGHCHATLRVPTHLLITCDHCRRSHRIRARDLATTRQCPACARALTPADVLLTPRRRHHHVAKRHHATPDNFSDAAWAVLIVGLTIVTVMALLVLL